MEKNIRISLLLPFYAGFLTEKQRVLMEMHYDDDLSLAEIAEREGITRQGVHDALKRGEEVLEGCEAKLGLFGKYIAVKESLDGLNDLLKGKNELTADETAELKAKLGEAAEIWEI
jgi:predicted DNA-binding protein YlxM (UPF0122 family)